MIATFSKLVEWKSVLILSTCVTIVSGDCLAGENQWTLFRRSALADSLMTSKPDLLVIDPFDVSVIYACVADSGFLRSKDGGAKWELMNQDSLDGRIKKITVDPFHPATIYAFTDGGLFRSNNRGEQWHRIGLNLAERVIQEAVTAIAVVQHTYDTLYVSIGKEIYRSQDGGENWKLLPQILFSIDAKINAMVVSPIKHQQLYVGTDKGIYKIEDDHDMLRQLRGPDYREQKTVDLVVDPLHTKIVFALFEGPIDTSGVYWAQDGEWVWREMNEGLNKVEVLPLKSLSLNPNRPRSLYAPNQRGDLFEYRFEFPQVCILDFNSTLLPPWEISAFSLVLTRTLGNSHSVKWISKSELNRIDGSIVSTASQEAAMAVSRLFGFEYVLSGEIYDFDGQLAITPNLTFAAKDTQEVMPYSRTIKTPRSRCSDTTVVRAVVKWFYEKVGSSVAVSDSTGATVNLYELSSATGYSRKIWLGGMLGFGLGYLITTLMDEDNGKPCSSVRLPLPPQFP